jgi:hypothetical protein
MAKFVVLQNSTRASLNEESVRRWARAWSTRFSDGLTHLTPRIKFIDGQTAAILFDQGSGWAGIGENYLFLGAPSATVACSGRTGTTVRFLEGRVDAMTDCVGSRAVWYGSLNGVSVISSSIRAAVGVLRGCTLDTNAVGWMLSAGNLGPKNSWAREVRKLPPASRVTLVHGERPIVSALNRSGHVDYPNRDSIIREVLLEAVEPLNDGESFALCLSGGIDSRVLLGSLRGRGMERGTAVTWGRKQALGDKRDDANVARRLAVEDGVPHVFMPAEAGPTPDPAAIVERFVRVSEGAVDWVAGYVDRFRTFEWLANNGMCRTVRGDQCFGSSTITDALHLRRLVHAEHSHDHPLLKRWGHAIPEVVLPDEYQRWPTETLSDWRDRLYRNVIIPYTLSALSETKTGFVEQVSPFLDSQVVKLASGLPPTERDNKRALRRLASAYYPDVPVATRSSLESEVDLLSRAQFGAWVNSQVVHAAQSLGLPEAFGAALRDQSQEASRMARLPHQLGQNAMVRKLTPVRLKRRVRAVVGPANAPKRRIAMRLIIASMASIMLQEDAGYSVDPST